MIHQLFYTHLNIFSHIKNFFSDNYAFVGPILREVAEPIEKAEIPTIYISLDTVNNENKDFTRIVLKLLKMKI